jgi:predicted ribosome quality control (RQC) complex YloA/Tae2 family protein
MFRVGKCWQHKSESIMLQLSPVTKMMNLPSKVYLQISCRKTQGSYVHLSTEKFAGPWDGTGHVASLARKYLAGQIQRIRQATDFSYTSIVIESREASYQLRLLQQGAVSIELVTSDNVSLVRMGPQGIFTKKKEALPLALVEEVDILPQWIERCQKESLSSETSKETLEVSDESSNHKLLSASSYQVEARRRLVRKAKTLRESLRKMRSHSASCADVETTRSQADLLKRYSYLIKSNTHELVLAPPYVDTPITIPIDPEASVGKNITRLYETSQKAQKSYEIFSRRISDAEKELTQLEGIIQQLRETNLPDAEIAQMTKAVGIGLPRTAKTASTENLRRPVRQFKHPSGVLLMVGKSASDNDELTKKAKADDTWLHAVSVTGSHVIIPRPPRQQPIPLDALRDAAILALHFSDLRQDYSGEVYITTRRNLRKPKGAVPGYWTILKTEQTLHVRYTVEDVGRVMGLEVL